jgi:hypothetical protein
VRLALGKITEKEAETLPTQLAFRLYPAQLENIERTLELARRMTGSESRSYHLEMICAEFRSTYENAEEEYPKAKLVNNLLSRIGQLLNVSFKGEVIDVATGEVVIEA